MMHTKKEQQEQQRERAEMLSRTLHYGLDCPVFKGADAADYIGRTAWVLDRFSKRADKASLTTASYLAHSMERSWLAPGVRPLNKKLIETFYDIEVYRLIKQLQTQPKAAIVASDKKAFIDWAEEQTPQGQEIILAEQFVRLAMTYENDLVTEKKEAGDAALPLQVAEALTPGGSALCDQIRRLAVSWQGVNLKRHRKAIEAVGAPELGRSVFERWLRRRTIQDQTHQKEN